MPIDPPSYGPLVPLIVQTLYDHVSTLSAETEHHSMPLCSLVRLIPMLAPNPPSPSSDAVTSQLISTAALFSEHKSLFKNNFTGVKFLARAALSSVYQMLSSHPDPRRVRPTSDATIRSICTLSWNPFPVTPGQACAVLAALFDENIDVPDLPSRSVTNMGLRSSPNPKRQRLNFDSQSYGSSQSQSSRSARSPFSNHYASPSRNRASDSFVPCSSSLGEFLANALER